MQNTSSGTSQENIRKPTSLGNSEGSHGMKISDQQPADWASGTYIGPIPHIHGQVEKIIPPLDHMAQQCSACGHHKQQGKEVDGATPN